MTTNKAKKSKSNYSPAISHAEYTTGQALRMARELNELSQVELANKTGICQGDISAMENDRLKLGAERAKVFAAALHIHPAMLLFPNWPIEQKKVTEIAS